MATSENERSAALAFRGEPIKRTSAEYLWICGGVKPLSLSDMPKVDYRPGGSAR